MTTRNHKYDQLFLGLFGGMLLAGSISWNDLRRARSANENVRVCASALNNLLKVSEEVVKAGEDVLMLSSSFRGSPSTARPLLLEGYDGADWDKAVRADGHIVYDLGTF